MIVVGTKPEPETSVEKPTADAICEALGANAEYERRDDYSGRGMYGKTTVGIVGDLGTLLGAVAKAASNLAEEAGKPEKSEGEQVACWETVHDFIEDVSRLRTDDMGKSDIIVY